MSRPDPDPKSKVARHHAMRMLLQPAQLKDSLTLAPQPLLRVSALAGLQAAVVSAIALPVVYLSPFADLIGFAALGALVAVFGRFAAPRRRTKILVMVALCQIGAVLLMSTAVWAGMSYNGQLLLMALLCGLFYFVSILGQFGPPGALIFIFAASAGMLPVEDFTVVAERTAAVAVVAVLAILLCAGSEWLRHRTIRDITLPPEIRPALRPLALASARMIVGGCVAAFAALAFGAPHPAWAAMGAVAVLQGQHLHIRLHRAVQRMLGAIGGALFVWVFLQMDPSAWTVIAVLIALQFLTELIIGTNYALGQILVTPMALLMVHLASLGRAGPELAPERVLVTILGACIGLVLAVLFSNRDERHHLAGLQNRPPHD